MLKNLCPFIAGQMAWINQQIFFSPASFLPAAPLSLRGAEGRGQRSRHRDAAPSGEPIADGRPRPAASRARLLGDRAQAKVEGHNARINCSRDSFFSKFQLGPGCFYGLRRIRGDLLPE